MTTLATLDLQPAYLYRLSDRATHDAMRALGNVLDETSYRDLYGVATSGALYAPTLDDAMTRLGGLSRHAQAMVRFLAVGLPTAIEDMAPELRELVVLSRACDLTTPPTHADIVATRGFVIVPALGGYLLVGTPPLYQSSQSIGATAYLGNDSLILAAALPSVAHKRVLDLGAGCGVQGLLAVCGADEVVLSDIDPLSLELAACNQILNAIQQPTRLVEGDGYGPVLGERFDLIVTLAPYVPTVDGSGTSSTVAGGDDGLQLLRRFAGEAIDHLEPGGEFVALAQLFCNDHGPLLAQELDELTPGLDSRLTLSTWSPLQPYVLALATKLSEHGAGTSRHELTARYSASLRRLGATGVCTALIRLRRPPRLRRYVPPRRELIGTVPTVRRSDVPVLGATLTGDRLMSWFSSPDGAMHTCNGPTSALVQAIDGQREIAATTEHAWGPFDPARRADLEDQAIARLIELAHMGLIRFDSSVSA